MDDRSPILVDYDLADPDSITELKADSVWRVDHASGRWVVAKRPLYDPGSRRVERFEAASRLMAELNAAGYPWAPAKRGRDGQYITVRDGSLYQVTAFVEGENNLAKAALIPEVGRALGAFHRYQETSSFDAQLDVHDFLGMTENGLENRRQELLASDVDRKPPTEAVDEAIDRFRAIAPALMALPAGLVHLDLSTANVLFQDGRLSAVIDFEAFFAPFILDLATAGLYWAIGPADGPASEPRADSDRLKSLLESYAEERPLGPDEARSIKDAFVWSAIRKWARGMGASHHSRYDTYRCCLDLDGDWMASIGKGA